MTSVLCSYSVRRDMERNINAQEDKKVHYISSSLHHHIHTTPKIEPDTAAGFNLSKCLELRL